MFNTKLEPGDDNIDRSFQYWNLEIQKETIKKSVVPLRHFFRIPDIPDAPFRKEKGNISKIGKIH